MAEHSHPINDPKEQGLPVGKTALFFIGVVVPVAILIPFALIEVSPEEWFFDGVLFRYVGLLLVLTAMTGYGFCVSYQMKRGHGSPSPGSTTELVTEGPYSLSRNPMYVCGIAAFAGLALVTQSYAVLAYSLLIGGAYYPLLIRMEERQMLAKFGDAYRAYSEVTPRWLPLGVREPPSERLPPRMRFGGDKTFRRTLQQRVDTFLADRGLSKRDSATFYLKAAIMLSWTVAAYLYLVFLAQSALGAVIGAINLGFASIFLAFNLYHDASHKAISRIPFINRAALFIMNLAGTSGYVWVERHVKMHHLYPNIDGYDCDLEVGAAARLSPHQPRHPWHRLQQWYLWPLYGLYPFQWKYQHDFEPLLTGRIGILKFTRPKGIDLALFVLGKALFVTLVFIVPLAQHSLPAVLGCYFIVYYVNGLLFSTITQISHITDSADMPLPSAEGAHDVDWAVHQVRSTCDFAHGNFVLTFLLGGLNYQIEHHLFPRLVHTRYPLIAPIVEQTCREFGIPYVHRSTFRAAVAAHFRHLHKLGRPVECCSA